MFENIKVANGVQNAEEDQRGKKKGPIKFYQNKKKKKSKMTLKIKKKKRKSIIMWMHSR